MILKIKVEFYWEAHDQRFPYVKTMFRKVFRSTPIIKTGSNTAEMVKYTTNCFLATKVSFANEMKTNL